MCLIIMKYKQLIFILFIMAGNTISNVLNKVIVGVILYINNNLCVIKEILLIGLLSPLLMK